MTARRTKRSNNCQVSSQHKARKETAFDIDVEVDVSQHDVSQPESVSSYEKFVEGIISQAGVIFWRIHTTDHDVIVMNDIDLKWGILMLMSLCLCQLSMSPVTRHSTSKCLMFQRHRFKCCHIRFVEQ
jgi:hypothetical protein